MSANSLPPTVARRMGKTAPKRRFWRDKSGMAATEFALLLPIMTFFFFAILEVSDAMIANRRVVNATNSLADLVTQEKKVSPSHVSDIFSGVMSMLEPTNSSTVTMRLVSVTLDVGDEDDDDDDRIVVEWSRQDNGSVPYSAGSEFEKIDDASIVKANTSLVIAEVVYQYNSGLSNRVLGSPITFTRMASRWPRRSSRVQFCNDSYTSCS